MQGTGALPGGQYDAVICGRHMQFLMLQVIKIMLKCMCVLDKQRAFQTAANIRQYDAIIWRGCLHPLMLQVMTWGEWSMEATARGMSAPSTSLAYCRQSDAMHRRLIAMWPDF